MLRIAVIYKSLYGHTKNYAEWIADKLDAILFEHASVTPKQLSEFEVIVYGGGIYVNGISGVELVAKNVCRHLVVFTVGMGDPETTDYSEIVQKNFPSELREKVNLFHFRGGLDYPRLSIIHRIMMMAVKRVRVDSKAEANRSEEDREFLRTYGKAIDLSRYESAMPLVEYVRSLEV